MFTNLHVHTMYSLLDGMTKVQELVQKIKEMGQTAVAITDHGVMYGAVDFYNTCKSAGIKPIIGCEVYVAPTSRTLKEEVDGERYYHLILLCKNEAGYKNLCKLVTRSNTEGLYYKPRIDFELLEQFHDGLICLSACVQGEVPRKIIKGNLEAAEEIALKYKKLFGDDYYFEIQNHGLKEEMLVAEELTRMSAKLGVKLVATNDCHYLNAEDAEAHEWLLCMQTGKTLKEEHLQYEGDYSVKSEEEMRKLFPAQQEAFDNTMEVADKCNFEFKFAEKPSEYRMPKVVIPGVYGNDYFGYIKDEAYKGLEVRYPEGHPEREQAIKNLEYELGIIKQMGFAEYFLDTRKTILWARDNGILVGPGRGSGAGSTLNYCLGITDLDPIKYGLLFERFLNPERVSMPDIDVDYCYSHKDDVIKSEADSNGLDRFCKIQTLGSLKAKGVVRDCARVAGYEPAVGNKLAKMIPDEPKMTLQKAYEANPDIEAYLSTDPGLKKLWEVALRLEGLKKSAGTHACGHVPVPVPCEELFPCSVDKKTGYLICQYNMTEVEHLGNLKKDLLMLRNLTIIEVAHKAIKERYGIDVPFWTEEVLNDKKALQLFHEGATNGIFQFESEGMKKFMKELKPTCFEDIIAGVSLYRPGPMDCIPDYIRGKHHPDEIVYDFDVLKDILAPTYGVITYQEQVMMIVQLMGGFSKGEADVVRKGMGKKKMDIIEAEGKKFIDGDERFPGCVKNGYDRAKAEALWAKMAKFGEYAFNKSHAACYAAISMQTAYLKAHYPSEFFAGLLTSVSDRLKLLAKYIIECKESGIEIHNPDINTSGVVFTSNADGSITYGLSAIKSVGEKIIEDIIAERNAHGKFKNISDIIKRLPESKITKSTINALAKAGALDSFGYTRAAIIAGSEALLKKVRKDIKAKQKDFAGQVSLFDMFAEAAEPQADELVNIEEMPRKELLFNEKEATGLYISGHPFEDYIPMLPKAYKDTRAFAVEEDDDNEEGESVAVEDQEVVRDVEYHEGDEVYIGGMLTNLKPLFTKKDGKPMASFSIEDMYGSVRCVMFPKIYADYRSELVEDAPVFVRATVKLDDRDATPNLAVSEIYGADNVPLGITIICGEKDDPQSILENIRKYEDRQGQDILCVWKQGQYTMVRFDRSKTDYKPLVEPYKYDVKIAFSSKTKKWH